MLDFQQYKETVADMDEASSEDTLELLLVFSAFSSAVFVAPMLYFVTNSLLISSTVLVVSVLDLAASQFLPSRIETEEDDES